MFYFASRINLEYKDCKIQYLILKSKKEIEYWLEHKECFTILNKIKNKPENEVVHCGIIEEIEFQKESNAIFLLQDWVETNNHLKLLIIETDICFIDKIIRNFGFEFVCYSKNDIPVLVKI
jgi:hypothetical protein